MQQRISEGKSPAFMSIRLACLCLHGGIFEFYASSKDPSETLTVPVINSGNIHPESLSLTPQLSIMLASTIRRIPAIGFNGVSQQRVLLQTVSIHRLSSADKRFSRSVTVFTRIPLCVPRLHHQQSYQQRRQNHNEKQSNESKKNQADDDDDDDKEDPDLKRAQGFKEKFKVLSKKYGWWAIGVYFGIATVDLMIIFSIVHFAGAQHVRRAEVWTREKLGLSQRPLEEGEAVSGNPSSKALWAEFILAWTIHKTLLLPIRVGITAAITPSFVRWMARMGWANKPKALIHKMAHKVEKH
ncbi:hypothetical protein PROFUN_05065 [Planoprotostelium fungivorum]|uniref:DUF1279 domain-containing protein n=1 Tax=Planoprotostelium fungivorum TaxID=1890364 RepID=A0A2P6NSJ5_9EUKA|nr:hypothetical protein PROFUN_05065 [Planoprotostelium fungivorum]